MNPNSEAAGLLATPVEEPLPLVTIYTDGSCERNPGGPGGWAAILKILGRTKEIHGRAEATTNNRMEITAAIEALRLLVEPCCVRLITDSEYLIYAIKGFVTWRKRHPSSIKNHDLVSELWRLMQPHQIQAQWVRGHSGHPENERCDHLASMR